MYEDEKFEDFCNNASDLMQSVRPDGSFRWVNNAWYKILGYEESETGDMTIFDILHPDELEPCREKFLRVMAGEDIGLVETVFVTSDGTAINVEGHVNCEMVEGKPYYTRAIFRDVTRRKQAEQEQERLIKDLQESLERVKTLHGLLPICAWCKKIRDDAGYWNSVEEYVEAHSHAEFTHGICPECQKTRL
jgi:PAS domain S-box-containing protein